MEFLFLKIQFVLVPFVRCMWGRKDDKSKRNVLMRTSAGAIGKP